MSDPTAAEGTSPKKKAPGDAENPAEAIDRAWKAHRMSPRDRHLKLVLGSMLRTYPDLAAAATAPEIGCLMRDPDLDPRHLSGAGWKAWLKLTGDAGTAATDEELDTVAGRLERDETALALIEESPVEDRTAEKLLTRVRRRLALTGRWKEHPKLIDALGRQAALNGGAWPFDRTEQAIVVAMADRSLARTHLPADADGSGGPEANRFADEVTRAVARQYEQWPYPVWTRVGRPVATTLADFMHLLDASAANRRPGPPRVLVAGCGTGGEAARVALSFPDVRVTAIDLSAASLDYARRRCAASDIPLIRFEQMDLHDVANLGEQFDLIYCSGVLHHLPDPEEGWAALGGALKPGGMMRIMVYSRIGRFVLTAVRRMMNGFDLRTADDDEVRRMRAWLLARDNVAVIRRVTESMDFSSLAGTRDLLCHPHEDPFDVPRIERTASRLGLRLLRIELATPAAEKRYAKWAPADPHRRDFRSWSKLEFEQPELFGSRYDFWCGKPADG